MMYEPRRVETLNKEPWHYKAGITQLQTNLRGTSTFRCSSNGVAVLVRGGVSSDTQLPQPHAYPGGHTVQLASQSVAQHVCPLDLPGNYMVIKKYKSA